MERAERKKRKAAKRAARTRQVPKRTRSLSIVTDAPATAASAIGGLTSSVTGILRNRSIRGTRRRISQSAAVGSPMGDVEEGIEMASVPSPTIRTRETLANNRRATPSPQQHVEFSSSAGPEGTRQFTNTNTNSETSSTSQTPSLHAPRTVGQLVALPTTWLQIYLRRLRHAHEDATKKQALKRAEKRQRVFGSGDSRAVGAGALAGTALEPVQERARDEEVGWGLGRFGIAEHEASVRLLRESGAGLGVDGQGEEGRRGSRDPTPTHTRRNSEPLVTDGAVEGVDKEEDGAGGPESELSPPTTTAEPARPPVQTHTETASPTRARPRMERRRTEQEPDTTDWEDMESSSSSGETDNPPRNRARGGNETGTSGAGGGWWDALINWRRADKATF